MHNTISERCPGGRHVRLPHTGINKTPRILPGMKSRQTAKAHHQHPQSVAPSTIMSNSQHVTIPRGLNELEVWASPKVILVDISGTLYPGRPTDILRYELQS